MAKSDKSKIVKRYCTQLNTTTQCFSRDFLVVREEERKGAEEEIKRRFWKMANAVIRNRIREVDFLIAWRGGLSRIDFEIVYEQLRRIQRLWIKEIHHVDSSKGLYYKNICQYYEKLLHDAFDECYYKIPEETRQKVLRKAASKEPFVLFLDKYIEEFHYFTKRLHQEKFDSLLLFDERSRERIARISVSDITDANFSLFVHREYQSKHVFLEQVRQDMRVEREHFIRRIDDIQTLSCIGFSSPSEPLDVYLFSIDDAALMTSET